MIIFTFQEDRILDGQSNRFYGYSLYFKYPFNFIVIFLSQIARYGFTFDFYGVGGNGWFLLTFGDFMQKVMIVFVQSKLC